MKILRWTLFAVLACAASILLFSVIPATAQSAPQSLPPSAFGGYASLSVTATTGNVALPAAVVPFNSVTIYNSGAKTAYVTFGGSTITATMSGMPVPSLKAITVWTNQTYIAAICAGSDSTSLGIYQANGPLWLQ